MLTESSRGATEPRPGASPLTRWPGEIADVAGACRAAVGPAAAVLGQVRLVTATTGRVPPGSGRKSGLDSAARRLSPAERASRGRAARTAVPRESQAVHDPPADRADPVSLLERQAATRPPDLVPVWYGRMLGSPFS